MMDAESGRLDVRLRTLDLLEWPELCRHIAQRALSPLGGRACRQLSPEESDEAALREMTLTTEMVALMSTEGGFPLRAFEDLEPMVNRARRGERLLGQELRQVGDFLGNVRVARKKLLGAESSCPSLADLGSALNEAAPVREGVAGAIDSDGQLREDASPRLRALRREVRLRRESIVTRLDTFVRDREAVRHLQDSYYTIREGRFVLPVRAEARSALGGIVHDISASGATHFLEPPWLVEMNNGLRVAELEAQKEAERILEELSALVARAGEEIQTDLEVMVRLDLIRAKGSFSLAVRGTPPGACREGEILLRGLRHPLLALRNPAVVPNDFVLTAEDRVLVISGPNAGGKTVLLKAIGLAALMSRAGLPVASEAGSWIPQFAKVFADIGDQQDIQQDISTFSGHMRNLREIMEQADGNSLVILDELAGSTDPQEGAALALAVLDALQERGARVVVTTHYPQMKAWAQGRSRVQNGAMEFDWERMEPTYRLRVGVPGQSSALEIARRMGLAEEVLKAAADRLQGDEIRLEALLRETAQQRSALEEERRKVALLRAGLEKSAAKEKELIGALREEREAFRQEKKRRLSAEIQGARQRIREAVKALSGARTRPEVERARAELREVEGELRPQRLQPSPVIRPLGAARPGDRVEVLPLGQRGTLLDDPGAARGRLRVQVGAMEVLVERDALGGLDPDQLRKPAGNGAGAQIAVPTREVGPEIDLRGMRAEEALEEVERYLDQALLSRRDQVRVIHGHGTGALKKAVRQWLAGCRWVVEFRAGDRHEGGDGATVVVLRKEDANPGG